MSDATGSERTVLSRLFAVAVPVVGAVSDGVGTETASATGRATATAVGDGTTITPPTSRASVTVNRQITIDEVVVEEAQLGGGGFLVVKRPPEFEIVDASP